MKVGDKYYEAWVSNIKGAVLYHEYTIKEVVKDGAWITDKHENELYWSLVDFELNGGKTKAEAIDKCIKLNRKYIDAFEKKIKILEAEKEKIDGTERS